MHYSIKSGIVTAKVTMPTSKISHFTLLFTMQQWRSIRK